MRSMASAWRLLLLTVAAALSLSAEAQSGTVIPVELHQTNLLVNVRINDSEPAWFIFDTGASVTVIDLAWAQKLHLPSIEAGKLSAGGGEVQARYAEGLSIDISGVRATGQNAALVALDRLPSMFGRDVKGIVGNTFIKDYVVEFDYLTPKLVLHPAGTRTLASVKDALPLENRGGVPFVAIELVLREGEPPIRAAFEIDSGSTGSLTLFKAFAEAHKVLEVVPPSQQVEGLGGAGLGGDIRAMDARLHALKLGPHELRAPIVSVLHDAEGVGATADAGLIGGRVLERFDVVLDLRSMRVLFTPNRRAGEEFSTDLSGLELIAEGPRFEKVFIKKVRDRSPASRVGLQAQDELVSVDGKPVGEIGLSDLSDLFRKPRRALVLVVRRGAKEWAVTLKLDRVI